VEQIEVFRRALRKAQQLYPFEIVAMVVLPDHVHAIWRLPEDDANYARRWSLIKASFTREVPRACAIREAAESGRGARIWQRRYWEQLVRSDDDLEMLVAYVHLNPVKHGYVTRAADWPYSSIHRDLENEAPY
jgi:putative transposase